MKKRKGNGSGGSCNSGGTDGVAKSAVMRDVVQLTLQHTRGQQVLYNT